MKRSSVFQRTELVTTCAALAAQATTAPAGFRQRDLKFYLELFCNWLQYSISEEPIGVANMQVARYLRAICREGFCREVRARGQAPHYVLTRVGMVELLRLIVSQPIYKRPAFLFFVEYFIDSYRDILLEMIKREGASFPPVLRLEVDSLLDLGRFRVEQRAQIEFELSKLELRIRDSRAMANLAERLEEEGKTFPEIAKQIERKYPYELNSQKPLSGLMANIPETQGRWELSTGGRARADILWQPIYELWQAYLKQLDSFED